MNFRSSLVLVLFCLAWLCTACEGWFKKSWNSDQTFSSAQLKGIKLNGFSTEFKITYLDSANQELKPDLDSLLEHISRAVDSQSPSSELSVFNMRDTLTNPSFEFLSWMRKAQKWHSESAGVIEFTDKPIQDIWTFTNSGPRLQDSVDVNFYLRLTGFQRITVSDSLIRKPDGTWLDFRKINEGVILDRIGAFLESKGIKNFYIRTSTNELSRGVNEKGELWKSRVTYLADSAEQILAGLIALDNKAVSSWGNEKEYFIRDSLKIGFTLDPRTGYPVNHGLLQAVVVSENAETSAALVNQLSISGRSAAFRLDSLNKGVYFMLIYHEKGGTLQQYISPELKPYLSFPVN